MNTLLITGCSSGFGLATARCFLDHGWQVIATMRTPREGILPASESLRVLALDVTDPDSVHRVVDAAGPIDVLVNNAGIGVMGALEGTPMDVARDVLATNVLGTMAMTRAVLPGFRARGAGVVVNVSSAVVLKPVPLVSVYAASKAAVTAFTESLALELEPFGVRAHVVLPGRAPETRFGEHARARMPGGIPEAYAGFAQRVFASAPPSPEITHAADVANAVWGIANDPSSPRRVAAGADAVALL